MMSVANALYVLERELEATDRLKIVAVSGPGEPLANSETFALLSEIHRKHEWLKLCLSTNGTLLPESLEKLKELGIDTISVSMSAARPHTAASIYEWAIINGKRASGEEMGERVISLQLEGIRLAAEAGFAVKVNTILIPSVNSHEMAEISVRIAEAGAALQNIVPLVPSDKMAFLRPPTSAELRVARSGGSAHIAQFTHCKQCRSDVVGIPGNDRIL